MNDKILASLQGEAVFRAVFQFATVGILLINRDGNIQLVNPFIENSFGYTAAELIGRPVEILVPDALQKSHISRRQAYFSNPRNRSMGYGLELFARKKNGAEFPVEISLGHYKLEGEHLAVAFITDITPRKKAEEKAERLEKEYRFIFEGIRESFMLQQIVRDKNNKIDDLLFLDVNQAAEELIGRKRDEIIGLFSYCVNFMTQISSAILRCL